MEKHENFTLKIYGMTTNNCSTKYSCFHPSVCTVPSSTRFDALVADELKQQQQDTTNTNNTNNNNDNNTTTNLGATAGSTVGSAAGVAAGSSAAGSSAVGSAVGSASSSRHRLVRVHPSFRVIALGIPGETNFKNIVLHAHTL